MKLNPSQRSGNLAPYLDVGSRARSINAPAELKKVGMSVGMMALAAITFSFTAPRAVAQDFPSKRVAVVVPYTPATGPDVVARTISSALESQLGFPFTVENREGATGVIGTRYVAKSSPDGYTLMVNAYIPFLTAPYTQTAQYDPVTSFAPIAKVGSVPLVLVTSVNSTVTNMQQLKDVANANPGKANYASTGNGAPGQLYMEFIKQTIDMKITEIQYKSSSQALIDTAAGEILANFASLSLAEPFIQGNKVRLIAVGSKSRLAKYPNVPTLGEVLGRPGFEAANWYGFFAPAGTPPERVAKLHNEIEKAMSVKAVITALESQNIIPELQSPSEFAASIRDDNEIAGKLMAATRAK